MTTTNNSVSTTVSALTVEERMRLVAEGLRTADNQREAERKAKIDRLNQEYAKLLIDLWETPDPTGKTQPGDSVLRRLPNAVATAIVRGMGAGAEHRPHFEELEAGKPIVRADGQRADGLRLDENGDIIATSVLWRIQKILRLLIAKTPSIKAPAWLTTFTPKVNHEKIIREILPEPPKETLAETAIIKPKKSKSAANKKLKEAAKKQQEWVSK